MKRFLLLCCFIISIPLLSLAVPYKALSVEVAPRISDREIVEGLAGVRGDIKRLENKIDSDVKTLEAKIESEVKRLDQRFDLMERGMNQRFDDLKWFLGIMIGALMVINSAVLGYVLKRQGKLEKSIETVKDELAFLKSIIEKLLPPKGVL